MENYAGRCSVRIVDFRLQRMGSSEVRWWSSLPHLILTRDVNILAGCRVLINLILLRVALTMSDGQTDVDIIPEYPTATTTFSDNRSFAGVVDFLVAKLPARYTRKDNG
jgi:hypothetical protein